MEFKTVLDGPTNYNVTPALDFFLGTALVIKVETTTVAQDSRASKMKVSSCIEVYFTTKTSKNLFSFNQKWRKWLTRVGDTKGASKM